jgi:hypothetical protein
VSPPPLAARYHGSSRTLHPLTLPWPGEAYRTLRPDADARVARTTSAAAKRPSFHCGFAGHTLDS